MDASVIKSEPDMALYAADEGLAVYRKIAVGADAHLTAHGRLFLEIGFKQEKAVSDIFQAALPKAKVIGKHDVAGHQRMIQVKK